MNRVAHCACTRQLDSVLFPKLHLIRNFGVFGALALVVVRANDGHAFGPLLICDIKHPHIPRRRNQLLNETQVLVQLLKVHARARINGELNHQETLVKEVIAKARGGLPLLVGHHWQIKHGHKPAHTERTVVHAAMPSMPGNSGTQNGTADISSYALASELAEASIASISLSV